MEHTQVEGIDIHTYDSGAEGPRFTVLGAIHGNEPCGPEAIRRVMADIESGNIKITKGTLVLAPVCNPRAVEQDVRFTERNMNRSFYPKDNTLTYEDVLQNALCPTLEQADYLLDLHSYTSPGEAMLIADGGLDNPDYKAFVQACGVPRVIFGFAEAAANNDDAEDPLHEQGTNGYARSHGGHALTLECGNHTHPRAGDVGYQSILNLLGYLNMAEIDEGLHIKDLPEADPYTAKIDKIVMKTRDGRFLHPMKNMDFVKDGTELAAFEDGEKIVMPYDGYVVMPKEDIDIGYEWMYIASKSNI
ncbi:MAG: succinylglutamate desuccinylase/aspartoacylase family protein [Pseudomonadota bacterium]